MIAVTITIKIMHHDHDLHLDDYGSRIIITAVIVVSKRPASGRLRREGGAGRTRSATKRPSWLEALRMHEGPCRETTHLVRAAV
jgi:hypothetical protein